MISVGSLVRPCRAHYTRDSSVRVDLEVCVLWRETAYEGVAPRPSDLVPIPWDSVGIIVSVDRDITVVQFPEGLLRATVGGLEAVS